MSGPGPSDGIGTPGGAAGGASDDAGAEVPGLRFRRRTELGARAVRALQEGPTDTAALARAVLGFGGGPRELAERLLEEALREEPRVGRDGAGSWRLRPERDSGAGRSRLAELEYAVVDVETTGSSPARGDRVTEIAVVCISAGEVVDEYSTLVDPGRSIPPWIRRLTGIDEAMVREAPRFEEVASTVRRRLEGRVFVAHNAAFDWRFVRAELERAASLLPEGPRLCTLRLARRALPGLSRRGLDALSRYYDVEIPARHRAFGDALATADILLRLLEEAHRNGVSTWATLDRWLGGEPAPDPDFRAASRGQARDG